MGHAPNCAGSVSVCMPIPIEFRSDRRICVTICAPEVRAPPLSRDAQARQRRDGIANAHGSGDGTAELGSLKVALRSRPTCARLSQRRPCGFWIYLAHSPRPMKCKWWRTRVHESHWHRESSLRHSMGQKQRAMAIEGAAAHVLDGEVEPKIAASLRNSLQRLCLVASWGNVLSIPPSRSCKGRLQHSSLMGKTCVPLRRCLSPQTATQEKNRYG